MFRRATFELVGGYREGCRYWEDLDLYWRMRDSGRIVVIPEALHQYRFHSKSVRAATDHEQLLGAVALMHRCLAELRTKGDYTPLLHDQEDHMSGKRLPPRVLTSVGSSNLWSGGSPAVLIEILRRGRLGWDVPTVTNLAWALLGTVSPSGLRAAIRFVVRSRDAVATLLLRNKVFVDWTFD
jgi:hypothetical protein